MDDDDAICDSAIKAAVERLPAEAEYPFDLPEPLSDVLLINWSMGLISNGGLVYFFEMQPPGDPAYSAFCDCYRRIGADVTAESIEAAAAFFPFADPDLDCDARRNFMHGDGAAESDRTSQFDQYDSLIYADDVWGKLAEYVRVNRSMLFS